MPLTLPLNVETWVDDRADLGGVWPVSLALLDLAYWSLDISEKRPGYRTLGIQWCWKRDRAYRLIRQWDKTHRSPIGHPSVTNRSPDPQRTLDIPQSSVTNRSPIGHQSVTQPIARFEPPSPCSEWVEASERYADLAAARGSTRRSKPQRTSPAGKALNARIKDAGLPAVLRVLDWWAYANHDRAQFLREKRFGLETVMRPGNFANYLEFADEPEPPTGAYVAPVDPDDPYKYRSHPDTVIDINEKF